MKGCDTPAGDELTTLVQRLADGAESISTHDTTTSGQRGQLEFTRREWLALCNAATLRDENALRNYLLLKARVEILEAVLARAPGERKKLVASFNDAVQNLASLLKELTGNSRRHDFENGALAPADAVALARRDVDEILAGTVSERDVQAFTSERRRHESLAMGLSQ